MSVRSLNRVTLIGNILKKPVLRKNNDGSAFLHFTVVTDREWVTGGELRQEATKNRCVAWDRLAENCEKLLNTGDKVYVEGRLNTKEISDPTTDKKTYNTEVVVSEVLLLSSATPKVVEN